MEIIIALAIAVLVVLCASIFMNDMPKRQNSHAVAAHVSPRVRTIEEVESERKKKEDNVMEEVKGTRDLLLATLTKMGCQYEIGEGEEGDINFGFQGEFFLVSASNTNRFIHIYDTHWGHIELYDIDEFARLKKAINESNIRNSVTAVYTIDEAGSNVNVHCKSVILFTPEIPDIADYLRWELSEFFRVHETICMEMARLRESEVGRQ